MSGNIPKDPHAVWVIASNLLINAFSHESTISDAPEAFRTRLCEMPKHFDILSSVKFLYPIYLSCVLTRSLGFLGTYSFINFLRPLPLKYSATSCANSESAERDAIQASSLQICFSGSFVL